MKALIVICVIVAAVIGLIVLMPCEACRKRRERLDAAYAEWRRRQTPGGN